MESFLQFFNINTIFFTAFNYQMSYLEFVGTLFTLWSVYLVAKNNILNWPIAIISGILFGMLFYQIQLYSDLFEQAYYIITAFYGWWIWTKLKKEKKNDINDSVVYNSLRTNIIYVFIIILGSIVIGYFMQNIDHLLPKLFPKPASYPYLDAFTTVISFVATILLVHKRVDSWYMWILVDVIGIWLYFAKGVIFISFLYVIFLFLATKGLFNWRKLALVQNKENEET